MFRDDTDHVTEGNNLADLEAVSWSQVDEAHHAKSLIILLGRENNLTSLHFKDDALIDELDLFISPSGVELIALWRIEYTFDVEAVVLLAIEVSKHA